MQSNRQSRGHLCANCFKPANNLCQRCRKVYYCSAACQKKDWILGHQALCGHAEFSSRTPSLLSVTMLKLRADKKRKIIPDRQWRHMVGQASRAAGTVNPWEAPMKGIDNIGNTCFANSVLQCLFRIPLFVRYIKSIPEVDSAATDEKSVFLRAFKQLLDDYYPTPIPPRPQSLPPPTTTSPELTVGCEVRVEGPEPKFGRVTCVHTDPRVLATDEDCDSDSAGMETDGGDVYHDANELPMTAQTSDSIVAVTVEYEDGSSELLPSQRVEPLEAPQEPSSSGGSGPIPLGNGSLYDTVQHRSSVYPRQTLPLILDDSLPLGYQHDSHEFLRFLLDRLESATGDLMRRTDGLEGPVDYDSAINSLLFGAWSATLTQCPKCPKQTYVSEPYLDLSIDLLPGVTSSVEDCLRLFTAPSRLDKDNKLLCECCHNRVRAARRILFYDTPMVLVIHLKRFDMNMMKNKQTVTFPTRLNLRPYCVSSSPHGALAEQYKLIGVVTHLTSRVNATLQSGHYVSYVRDGNGLWWRCDDETVTPATEDQVMATEAYLLFYTLPAEYLAKRLALQEEDSRRAVRIAEEQNNNNGSTNGSDVPDNEITASQMSVGGTSSMSASNETSEVESTDKSAPLVSKKNKKIGVNEKCPCGSGLKYKKCHGAKR